VGGAVAIIADPSISVDAALLDAAGETLEVVSNLSVRSGKVDLDAARARRMRVTDTPEVLYGSTAERRIRLCQPTCAAHIRDEAVGR
jgi:lactate dehydrogenase-like 2-hydroxyacid dehydrogenase